MAGTRLLADDLILSSLPVQNSHPMDSSRVLLGLMALSRKAAAAEANAPESDSLEGVISATALRSLLAALHFRDATTVQHARRVAMLAVGMAEHLGWEGRHLKLLEVAALLHDVGKIGVPDNILFKPGALSPDEVDLMALHNGIGVDVLQACRVEKEVLEIVGQARDYYNGMTTGFRRTGGTSHLGSRLLAVADAYDSLRSDQVYRKGKSHDEVMRILMENAGSQFDGNIVCALARWTEQSGDAQSLAGNAEHEQHLAAAQSTAFASEAAEASNLCHIFSYLYMLESLYDGFYLVDSDLRFVVWNNGVERLTGRPTADMLDRTWTSRLVCYADESGNPQPDQACSMHEVVASGRATSRKLKVQHAGGRWIDVETQTVPLIDEHGRLQGVTEIFRDLSRSRRRPQEYRDLRLAASRDALTNVANRGELETQLTQLVADTARANWVEPFSIIFLDVDHFKKINDTFGHAVGDTVLVEVARLMQHETYSGELVGRYGGEEFVIICPGTDMEQAVKRAERIRLAVSRLNLQELESRQITASFGVTQAERGDSVESVLRRADKALYAAKHGGRNQTRSFTTEQMNQREEVAPSTADSSGTKQMVYQTRFYACIAAEMVVYKLGGFVNDEKAKLIEVTPTRALLQLGTKGFFSSWGSTDERRPVEVELGFVKESATEGATRRAAHSNQMQVQVRIRPVGKIKQTPVFEDRAKRVAKRLSSYFAADLRMDD